MSTATASSTAMINTSKVGGRRELHFTKLTDIQTDAEHLASRPVRQLGNWQLGYALSHMAGAMKISLDGANFRVPFYIRMFAPLIKKRLLRRPMKPGFKLPENASKTLMPSGPVSTQEGLDDLRKTIERLNREPKREPSPFFGRLTREEWDQLHLRHSELHLSFYVPE